MNIYSDIPELLSVSLGAAETTLIDLTSAYAPFVNGGKKINAKLISRIQDRRGRQSFKKNRKCVGCDKFINEEIELQKSRKIKKFLVKKLLIKWLQSYKVRSKEELQKN